MADIAPSRFKNVKATSQTLSTVIDYIRLCISEFNQHDVYYGHGTENAWQEAQRLVFTALSLPLDLSPPEQVVFHPCVLTQKEREHVLDWLQLRCEKAIPLPYLSQQAWFAGMPFFVDERVLIPRSPFAELIANKFSGYMDNAQPTMVLDMCTGGGCIAIALSHLYPDAQVDAVDIDSDALDVASINIYEYELEDRVFPIQSDLFSHLGPQLYDLIVVNPPYVDVQDMDDLPREYHHEPKLALASGEDGLDLTLQILKQASAYMSDNAWLFIEVGNSELNFSQRFGDFEVSWCELSQGGSGIFAINKTQLDAQVHKLSSLK